MYKKIIRALFEAKVGSSNESYTHSINEAATKTDKFSKLKNKIVAENDEWNVYKIDTADEAILFHDVAKWGILGRGIKPLARTHFDGMVFDFNSNYYFIARKNPIGDKWDYIALWLQPNRKRYLDKNDRSHKSLPAELNVPELNVKYEPMERPTPETWKLNSDGMYNVNDDVELAQFKHFVGPDGKLTVKFNKVSGYFDCRNLNLTSLEGCPKEVGESFYCSKNKLTTLEGAPKKVGGDFKCEKNQLTSLKGCPEKIPGEFDCGDNNLTSLEGAPKEVGDYFICRKNKLTSLKGGPKEVGGSFWCSDNKLTSLIGAPEKIGRDFYCHYNKLTSLEGAPKEVGKRFDCSNNKLTSLEGATKKIRGDFWCGHNKLTSLKGAPEEVGGSFFCSDNKLTSLEGAPKKVKENFYCSRNTKKFTKADVEKVCKVMDSIYTGSNNV
jgi:hypothetical protein